MKQFSLLGILLVINLSVFSQGVLFFSPVDQGIGRTGTLGVDSWSFFSNPAGLSGVDMPSAGIGYYSGFHIKELASRAAFGCFPTSLVTVAGGFTHYGYEHFNIQQYALAAARQMAPWLRLGIRINYFLRNQTGSERLGLATLDAGFQIDPDPKVSIGFFTINPARLKWNLSDWSEYQASGVAAAIGYKPVQSLNLELGVLKNVGYPVETCFAIEAPIHKQVVIRGAVTTEPLRLGFGAGFKWQLLSFDLGINHHSTLGFSSSFGILFYLRSLSKNNTPIP